MSEVREPYRSNLYECVKRTCQLAQRTTYLNRIIYIGEQHFGEKLDITFAEVMTRIVDTVNSDYCLDHLTGLLVLYPNYFIHLIDGSEDSLTKHFKMLLEYREYLGRMKILVVYNHANQRFFKTWGHRTAKPPTLLEKISPLSDEEECFRHLQICITKIYNLAKALRVEDMEHLFPSVSIDEIRSDMSIYLPEYLLLEFLLGLEYLDDVENYANVYMTVPEVELKEENVWPIRLDFIPRDVFDIEQEVIPDLPEGGTIVASKSIHTLHSLH